MKLNELKGYKSDPHYQSAQTFFHGDLSKTNDRIDRLTQFEVYLKNNGFNSLGSGQGGLVFENPKYQWAFKIFSNDPAYSTFLKYVRVNQHNPHLPKIKGNIIRINEHTNVIRIEKLEKAGGNEFDKLMRIISGINTKYDLNRIPDGDKMVLMNDYPWMYRMMGELLDLNTQFELDLNRPNVMVRNDGTFVVVDPLIQ